MKVMYVTPPCSWQTKIDIAPPLWALTLAAISERQGWASEIVDLNLEAASSPELGGPRLYGWFHDVLSLSNPDLLCFSSMAVNSHVSLTLAKIAKEWNHNVINIIGGPHFSAIATEVLEHYPWIDIVALGEAELAFEQLLVKIARGRGVQASNIEGLVCRSGFRPLYGRKAQRPNPPDVPPPAFHLVDIDRYFQINPTATLDFDAGQRGCAFSCRYCYAPFHLGQGERRQDPETFVRELRRVAALGAQRLFFVQDNFVNNPRATIELCERITHANLDITFHCYATLQQLTDPVIRALARAGCASVYVGVDAVHPESRERFGKHLFRGNKDMLARLGRCVESGVIPTAAFLLEEPCSGSEALEDTIATAMMAKDVGCRIRFNTLSLYPGTAAYDTFEGGFSYNSLKPRLLMDVPPVLVDNPYAAEVPALFPFHSTHRSASEEMEIIVGTHVLYSAAQYFPETVLQLAAERRCWEVIRNVVGCLDVEAHIKEPEYLRRGNHIECLRDVITHIGNVEIERVFYEEDAIVQLAQLYDSSCVKDTDCDSGKKAVRSVQPFVVSPTTEYGKATVGVLTSEGVVVSEVDENVASVLRKLEAGLPVDRESFSAGKYQMLEKLGIVGEENDVIRS